MQKFLYLLLPFFFLLNKLLAQADFSSIDCNGTNHHLYAELDSGKVVIICWVMPCSSCIGPAMTSYNIAQSFNTQYPGKVVYYLVDDFGNTNCTSLTSWKNANQLNKAVAFSDPEIDMYDYGSIGMPKVVIVAGAQRTVFYNADYEVNSSLMVNAMENAFASFTNIPDDQNVHGFSVYPNPAKTFIRLNFSPENITFSSIELFSPEGILIRQFTANEINFNNSELPLNEIPAGIYFLRIRNAGNEFLKKIIIGN